MPHFQRSSRGKHERTDDVGVVRVTVQLAQTGTSRKVRGNLNRTISIRDAKVSDVTAVIEEALFGPNEEQG